MCRNIRVLYNFEPPTSREEMRAAALQYVRKVTGVNTPSLADRTAFENAVDEVASSTERLLAGLKARAPLRTREMEQERARTRWRLRQARLPG
jgi:hypothetical protein